MNETSNPSSKKEMGVNEWLGVLTLLAVGVIVIYASISAGWNIVGIVIGLVFAGSSVLGTPQIRDFVHIHITINSVRGRGGSKITQRDVSNSAVVGGDVYGDVIVNKPVDSPESSRQDREVKNILQGLIPFFTEYDNGSMQNPWDFLTAFKGRKNQLLGFKSTMKLRVPKIEPLLTELLDLLNPTTYFKYNIKQPGMPEIVGNPRFKQLVSELRKEMDEWLSNHP